MIKSALDREIIVVISVYMLMCANDLLCSDLIADFVHAVNADHVRNHSLAMSSVSSKNCLCKDCLRKREHRVLKQERKLAHFFAALPIAIGAKDLLKIVFDYYTPSIDLPLRPLCAPSGRVQYYPVMNDAKHAKYVNQVQFEGVIKYSMICACLSLFASQKPQVFKDLMHLAPPDVLFHQSEIDEVSEIIRDRERPGCTFTSVDGQYKYHIDSPLINVRENWQIRGTYRLDIVKRLLYKE